MIKVIQDDITVLAVDAIVNAANTYLIRGGGVCGAIHKAAGIQLEIATRALAPCETGNAVITGGFGLPSKFVIHAVGPIFNKGAKDAPLLLEKTYLSCLKLAEENNIKSIAFPCISTGIFGFPKKPAAEIAIKTVKYFLNTHSLEVTFVCFEDEDCKLYQELLG